jgi:hypothetical protein
MGILKTSTCTSTVVELSGEFGQLIILISSFKIKPLQNCTAFCACKKIWETDISGYGECKKTNDPPLICKRTVSMICVTHRAQCTRLVDQIILRVKLISFTARGNHESPVSREGTWERRLFFYCIQILNFQCGWWDTGHVTDQALPHIYKNFIPIDIYFDRTGIFKNNTLPAPTKFSVPTKFKVPSRYHDPYLITLPDFKKSKVLLVLHEKF